MSVNPFHWYFMYYLKINFLELAFKYVTFSVSLHGLIEARSTSVEHSFVHRHMGLYKEKQQGLQNHACLRRQILGALLMDVKNTSHKGLCLSKSAGLRLCRPHGH